MKRIRIQHARYLQMVESAVRGGEAAMIVSQTGKILCCEDAKSDFVGITAAGRALIRARAELRGCRLYLSRAPRYRDLSYIADAGIKEIYFPSEGINKVYDELGIRIEAISYEADIRDLESSISIPKDTDVPPETGGGD